MKLPVLTAQQALGVSQINYKGAVSTGEESSGLAMTADIGCLVRCVGTTAYNCIHCGSDLACWAECAGPQAVGCIAECF